MKNLFLILNIINVINASHWYDLKDTQLAKICHNTITITTTNNGGDVIKTIKARSPIECTLKCKTMYQKQNSFYTKNNDQCFCLQNSNNNGGNMIRVEDGVLHGKFISRIEAIKGMKGIITLLTAALNVKN